MISDRLSGSGRRHRRGAATRDRLLFAVKRALGEIARVLDREPSTLPAILAAGEIDQGRSDHDRAHHWYGRLATIDSSNAAAFAGSQ